MNPARQAVGSSEPTPQWSQAGGGSLETQEARPTSWLENWRRHLAGSERVMESEIWGDFIIRKEGDTIRIMFQNINGLPTFNKHSKNDILLGMLEDYDVDIMAMTEINVHWLKVPQSDRLYARTDEWFEKMEHSLAYNSTETPETAHQWGGTAVWARNRISHHVMGKGSDATGLGRWCWLRFRGKTGMILRVVSAYCPQAKGGIDSVPGQHQAYLNLHDDERTPREAFWEDLTKDVTAWNAMGDQVIITGDWNCDI